VTAKAQEHFERNERPMLFFFTRRTSGPARRMESLIAHYARKERERLRVLSVDVDDGGVLARRFAVKRVPTLLLVKDDEAVGRIEGRATGTQIEELIDEYVR
jgi:thioredoxin-like negative regulator of GroEL